MDAAAIHSYPGLHFALDTPTSQTLSHRCLFGQVKQTKEHLCFMIQISMTPLSGVHTPIWISQHLSSFSCHAQVTPGRLPSFTAWKKGFRSFKWELKKQEAWKTLSVLSVCCISLGKKDCTLWGPFKSLLITPFTSQQAPVAIQGGGLKVLAIPVWIYPSLQHSASI